ncbi:MAG: hypothetical protein FJX74_22890, partial [Armatimonadetes bacterium]|nr:hypothetical protein [Armatimonadota bacterium]
LAFPRPEGTLWNNLAAEPYVLEARALAARDILRGWRGYGMSGMTFHAEEDDLFETWSRLGETFPERTPAELQTPGPKPELKYQWFPRYYYADRPNQPFHESFRRNFQPLLAFIGGATLEPERTLGDFTAKDHAYYAGETIAKQVVIVNDRTDRDLRGRYAWRAMQAAAEVARGDGAADVGRGEIARLPLRFVAPPATVRTDLRIELKVTEGNETVGDDSLDVRVYPRAKPSPAVEPVALLDTSDGRTGAALAAAGVAFEPVTSAAQLVDRRCVVVGQGALPQVTPVLAQLETSGRLAQGMNLLVLAQPPCPLLNLIHEPTYERYAWPRDPSHPVIAGLTADELANWRGASEMCAAYPPTDPRTLNAPHYPGLKWHWGNRGIVSTYPFRKPAYGNFRVLADDGFDLVLSPLMEWLEGSSRLVLCQFDLTERAGADPVATGLLRELCAYVASAPAPTWHAATYVGSEAGRECLAPHLMQDSARVPDDGVIASDGALEPAQRDTLLAHADRGGTALLVNPTVEALQALGLQAEEQKVWRALAPDGDWPLLAGVSPSDLYWRDERPAPVLTDLPAGSRATTPAVIAETPRGKGRLVVWTVSAGQYDDRLTAGENNRWNTHRAYYAKTANHDKIHRALTLILTNLGVRMRHPRLALFTGEYGQNGRVANALFRVELPEWRFRTDPDDVGKAQGWERPDADDAAWQTLRAPGMWQDQGITDDNPRWQYDDPSMKRPYNGVAWYRVRVTVPEVLRGRDLYFDADSIDDYDEVYFNGERIGQTGKETPNWWSVPRHYRLPVDAIHFGAENALAVRVTDTAGSGG